jgi:hypothetical protein
MIMVLIHAIIPTLSPEPEAKDVWVVIKMRFFAAFGGSE